MALNGEEFKTMKALFTLPWYSAGCFFPRCLCPSPPEDLRYLVDINVNLHKGEIQCVGQTPGLSSAGHLTQGAVIRKHLRIFLWKEIQIQIFFFSLPVSKAQDLYSTASSPSWDTPSSPQGKSPFLFQTYQFVAQFLGLALQFQVFDNWIVQLPLNTIFTTEGVAQSHKQGTSSPGLQGQSEFQPRRSSHPPRLHFPPWMTPTDQGVFICSALNPSPPDCHTELSPHFSPSITSLFPFLSDADIWTLSSCCSCCKTWALPFESEPFGFF